MTETQRRLAFLLGCMGSRLALTLLAYYLGAEPSRKVFLQAMGVLALGPAVGFAVIFIGGWRKTGPETSGEAIWWNDLRPVHSILWFVFAGLAIAAIGNEAWKFLLIDTVLGFAAYAARRL